MALPKAAETNPWLIAITKQLHGRVGRLRRNQLYKTSCNQEHYDPSSEGNGRQIHNLVIGFEPALWVLNHLNSQFKVKWPAT